MHKQLDKEWLIICHFALVNNVKIIQKNIKAKENILMPLAYCYNISIYKSKPSITEASQLIKQKVYKWPI